MHVNVRGGIFIGPFPPPLHGASAITQKSANLLLSNGISIETLNTSPKGVGFLYHISRLTRFLVIWNRLLSLKKGDRVYISLSGGWGLVYDAISVLCLRGRGGKSIFHHHSFSYINSKSGVMSFIVKVAGKAQTHVFLAASMAEKFEANYGHVYGKVISNLTFFPRTLLQMDVLPQFKRIGFLSNITFVKGFDRFIDLMEMLKERGSSLAARVAGPIHDPDVLRRIESARANGICIDYVGAVFGTAKDDFFASIDYFVFPSRYVNEAQPLVVFEAQLAGLPVAMTKRGSLQDMAGPDDWLLDPHAIELSNLADHLMALEADSARYCDVRNRCIARRATLLDRAEQDQSEFCRLFL